MTGQAGTPRPAAALSTIPLRRRLYGFGSIYGKTIRDSRHAFIMAARLFGGLSLVMGAAISTVFPNPEARVEIDELIGSMPTSMVNLFGVATLMGPQLGTLGALQALDAQGPVRARPPGGCSIPATYGTLAGRGRPGASTWSRPRRAPSGGSSRGWAQVTSRGSRWPPSRHGEVSSYAYGDPKLGDPVPLAGTIGFALWAGLIATCLGGLALALAPLLVGPARPPSRGSPCSPLGGKRTERRRSAGRCQPVPLVGQPPPARRPPSPARPRSRGISAFVLLAIGVELFGRRDLGVTTGLSLPGLPTDLLAVRGPIASRISVSSCHGAPVGLGMGIVGAFLSSLV